MGALGRAHHARLPSAASAPPCFATSAAPRPRRRSSRLSAGSARLRRFCSATPMRWGILGIQHGGTLHRAIL